MTHDAPGQSTRASLDLIDRIAYETIATKCGFIISGWQGLRPVMHGVAADVDADSITYDGREITALRVRVYPRGVSITAASKPIGLTMEFSVEQTNDGLFDLIGPKA